MQHEIYHQEGSRPDEVGLRIRPDIRLPNVFQKDEKKDEKKAEGIHMNTGCMLECLSLQHAQVIVLEGALKNKKWNNLKRGLWNRCHWSSNEG